MKVKKYRDSIIGKHTIVWRSEETFITKMAQTGSHSVLKVILLNFTNLKKKI